MNGGAVSHVRYIDKTRAYYQAEGYDKPYGWANFDRIPFTPFASIGRPLSQCRVGVVTSSEMARRDAEAGPDDLRRLVYALPTDLPVDQLYSKKAAYDRYARRRGQLSPAHPPAPLGRRGTDRGCGAPLPGDLLRVQPGQDADRRYEWSADHSWKDKVFSKAQPFLDPEATSKWLERKEKYRALKAAGRSGGTPQ